MPERIPIGLDAPALHVDVRPSGEIVISGSYKSTFDGSEIDAATTTWPAGAPGGQSVDAGGLIDFAGGGFHVTSRDPATHIVHAVATDKPAPACAAAGVAAPCLPMRVLPQAQARLITMAEWRRSLNGQMSLEVLTPPVYAPAVEAASSPALRWGAAAVGVLAIAGIVWVARRRQAASPTGQLLALARRVQGKLGSADRVLAAPLSPALTAALTAVRERRVDATSKEGKRVASVLSRVEATLDKAVHDARADQEREVADELVREVESALEAAAEAEALAGGRKAAVR